MKLRSYKNLFLEIIQHINEGVHVIDEDGKTVYYNKRMEELEQLTGKEVINKPFDKVFQNLGNSTMLRSIKSGEPIKDELQNYINRYGKQISTVNTTIPIIEDEKVIAVMEIAQNVTQLKEMSDTILELQKGDSKNLPQKNKEKKHYTFDTIVGRSSAFMKAVNIAQKAKNIDASVFIFGETGTGKELIAQSIHFSSERKDKPFIAQNCAAIPEALLEGILFGTAKGGFTGAVDRQGVFEQANGGTLLLDEINSMPYDTQAKLLRVLQEGYIRRIGGTKDIPVDVRIIAISNESSRALLERADFRKDLYYRLSVINIEVPSLRDRKDDILLLADTFIAKYNNRMNKQVWMLSEDAKKLLSDYTYPGNVRELENIIARGISMIDDEHVLSAKMLDVSNIKDEKFKTGLEDVNFEDMNLDEYIENIERQIIEGKMYLNNNNISKTAKELGIKRQTLQHKLKKFGIKEIAE